MPWNPLLAGMVLIMAGAAIVGAASIIYASPAELPPSPGEPPPPLQRSMLSFMEDAAAGGRNSGDSGAHLSLVAYLGHDTLMPEGGDSHQRSGWGVASLSWLPQGVSETFSKVRL